MFIQEIRRKLAIAKSVAGQIQQLERDVGELETLLELQKRLPETDYAKLTKFAYEVMPSGYWDPVPTGMREILLMDCLIEGVRSRVSASAIAIGKKIENSLPASAAVGQAGVKDG